MCTGRRGEEGRTQGGKEGRRSEKTDDNFLHKSIWEIHLSLMDAPPAPPPLALLAEDLLCPPPPFPPPPPPVAVKETTPLELASGVGPKVLFTGAP